MIKGMKCIEAAWRFFEIRISIVGKDKCSKRGTLKERGEEAKSSCSKRANFHELANT